MGAQDYEVLLGGVSLARGRVRPDRLLAIDAGDVRQGHGLTGEATRDPSFDCPAIWIEPRERDHAIAEGFLTVDPSTVIATHANQALLAQAQELLGPEEARELLDALKESSPSLVETVHPEPLSLAAITRIFRALIADGIGLGHPQAVLTSLALALQRTQEFDLLVDAVRADMGAKLIARICEPGARLRVATLDANLEAAILGSVPDPATGQPLIEPECGSVIAETLTQILEAEGEPIALIVQPPVRRSIATLLSQRVPRCLVLSINELPATQPVEVVGVIGAEAEPQPPAAALSDETAATAAQDEPGAMAA